MDSIGEKLVEALESLARDLPGGKRLAHKADFELLSEALGLEPTRTKHLSWPLPSWPSRGESSVTRDDAYRYAVDFGYGDRPDHRNFAATFEQVRKLLNYTRDSCKVAFGTAKGRIDRTQRPTKLGPCVITRLPHVIELKNFPDVLPFQVKLDEAPQAGTKVIVDDAGRKRVKPRHGNRY